MYQDLRQRCEETIACHPEVLADHKLQLIAVLKRKLHSESSGDSISFSILISAVRLVEQDQQLRPENRRKVDRIHRNQEMEVLVCQDQGKVDFLSLVRFEQI